MAQPSPPTPFELPQLDALIMDEQLDLTPEALATWLAPGEGVLAGPATLPAAAPGLELTSSGGGSAGTDTTRSLSKDEEERQERTRAANRAKQARFRQRQKERKEQLAAEFESMAADLQRAQLLNDSLKTSCATLEAVKSQKDTAVEALEAAASGDQATAQPQADALAVSRGAALAQRLWSLPFRERIELCTSLFRQVPAAYSAAQLLCTEPAGEPGSDLCLGLPDGFSLNLERKQQLAQQVALHHPELVEATLSLSPETLRKEWAELGELAAEVVELFDAGEISEAELEARASSAVFYFAILGSSLLTRKPETLQHLFCFHRLPGETDEQAAARWREVALAMGVTKEQCQLFVPAYQTYCDRMRTLREDTAAAMQTVQEVQESLSAQMLEAGLSATVQQYLKLFEAAGQLSHQPHAALLIRMEFMSTSGAFVTPLQKTRMIAMCRPLHPDVLSILHEVLAHHGLLPANNCVEAPPAAAGAGPAPP